MAYEDICKEKFFAMFKEKNTNFFIEKLSAKLTVED